MSVDIFLSYASEDVSKAMELARILEVDGWSVWWDREISPGQDFEVEIDMALSAARAVVVLWSAYSVASNWVRNEAREAKESNKLIPVQLDQSRIPLSYRSLTTIDLRKWPDQPSIVELSMLKSALSRVLLSGVSDQMLKKPEATDEMTLSVRVASRVAEMVDGRSEERAGQADAASLQVERCISDILLELLTVSRGAAAAKREAYIMQLAGVLGASLVVKTTVDFSRMSVSDMACIDGSSLGRDQEKRILGYVNDYCSPMGDYNLHLKTGEWSGGGMLCMPLAAQANGREFAWFVNDAPNPVWNWQLQDRILRLASGLLAREGEGD